MFSEQMDRRRVGSRMPCRVKALGALMKCQGCCCDHREKLMS